MTLEEAERVLLTVDMTSTDRFSPEEREAIVTVTEAYMMGHISAERAAKAMHCTVGDLPKPWEVWNWHGHIPRWSLAISVRISIT